MIKALLVDDMQDELLLLQYLFRKHKIPIAAEACSNAETAAQMLATRHYDMLITDIRMPFLDGLDLSKIAIEHHPSIKIMIVSGYGDFAYAKSAISLGVCEYLLKPIQPDDFIRVTERLMQQIQAEQADRRLNGLNIEYSKHYLLQSLLQQPDQAGASLPDPGMLIKGSTVLFVIKYPIAMADLSCFDVRSILEKEYGEHTWIVLHLHSGMDAVFLECGESLPSAEHQQQMAQHIITRHSALMHKPCWVAFGAAASAQDILGTYEALKSFLDQTIRYPHLRIFYTGMSLPANTVSAPASATDTIENKIAEVQSYIYQHFGEELTLEKLAGTIHVHPDYLSRVFKKVTGYKLSTFIKIYKMEQAKIFLSSTFLKITEISHLVGYPSCSYFCQVFSDEVGLSPEKYRQKHREA